MTPVAPESLAFEQALSELERILRNLEDGTATLEQSLTQYERGVSLLKGCYQHLRAAEQRILRVTGLDGEGKPILRPFEHSATLEASSNLESGRPTTRSKPKEGGTLY